MTRRSCSRAVLCWMMLTVNRAPADDHTSACFFESVKACSVDLRVTVFYANGINNTPLAAAASACNLQKVLEQRLKTTKFQLECLRVDFAYNSNEVLFLDFFEAARQAANGNSSSVWQFLNGAVLEFTLGKKIGDAIAAKLLGVNYDSYVRSQDPDLVRHVDLYTTEIVTRGRKVVVVAHSQGNFYANLAHDELLFRKPMASGKIDVIATATPASTVAGGGRHTTIRQDIIRFVPGALAPNVDNQKCKTWIDCHDFNNSYLVAEESKSKILDDIISVLPQEQNPGLSTIAVASTLDGQNWSGSVNYSIVGPTHAIIGTAVPGSTADLPAGQYTLSYNGGGPVGSMFLGISPCTITSPPSSKCTVHVTPNQSFVFFIRFAAPPKNQPPTAGFVMTTQSAPSVVSSPPAGTLPTMSLSVPRGHIPIITFDATVIYNGIPLSKDPEGGPLSFEWMSNGTRIPNPSFSGGIMQFGLAALGSPHRVKLVARDSQGLTASAEAQVVVTEQTSPTPADAVQDFSSTQNPNGVWSYGFMRTLGGHFAPHTAFQQDFVPGIDRWLTPTVDPVLQIARNKTSNAILGSPATFTYPSDMLHLHPAADGTLVIVRWTGPTSGTFSFEGKFTGLDNVVSVADTDVHVLHNLTTELLQPTVLRGVGTERTFAFNLTVAVGDTVDFAVGKGPSGFHQNDSTGLKVTITPISSQR